MGTKRNDLLRIEGLSLAFGGVQVLTEISLSVKKGDIFSIIGPNGAGKTSLLNCINMHYRPQGGGIIFDGKELKETLSIDFLAAKLGAPHQMRFGAYALYGEKTAGR